MDVTDLTIMEARRALHELPEHLAKAPGKAMCITRRGRPVLALLPWDIYESIVETLEVLSDPETTYALRASLKDIRKGRLIGHEAARKRLLRQRLVDR